MEAKKKFILGLFAGGSLLLFAVALFLIGNSTQLFTKSFDLSADFAKVTGLEVGTKVRVAGMDGGAVTVIEVPSRPDSKFRVRFRVIESLHPLVRQDSVATIQTDGLLGNKFLEVDAGSNTSARAKNGSGIQSKEPFDFADLMDQVSATVKSVSAVVAGVEVELTAAVGHIGDTAESANLLVKTATPGVKNMIESSNRIATSIGSITEGIRDGRGSVGALFNDQALADNLRRTVSQTEQTVQNLRETTSSAKRIVTKVESSDLVPQLEQSVKTVRQITESVKSAVNRFEAASGEGGVGENLQRTLADAHEAMSDLSEDTEALKHNFLFRGFFKRRGFYDLGSLSLPEYKAASFAKGFQHRRFWLASSELFVRGAGDTETLSVLGKKRLDEVLTEVLQFPRNGPLMIEGFAGPGNASQQHLQSRQRAVLVQTYITYRFHLRPAYVGIVAMGAPLPENSTAAGFTEGVSIVSFFKK